MATANHNLSDYQSSKVPDGHGFSFAVVVSEWNAQVTEALSKGAVDTLLKHGVSENKIQVFKVPGSYELPTGADFALQYLKVDAVICLGSIVQGETPHFNFVCEAVAQGIKDVALRHHKPVIFGVLTDNNLQQAIDRAGGKHGNKGVEAAISALKMAYLHTCLKGMS
jgi:6,7-dimethyl-8-ribityllumazine synthase